MGLIVSEKHTVEDLSLWRDYAYCDQLHANKVSLTLKIERARNVIEKFMKRGCYAGISWGKDSTVIAHLCHGLGITLVNLRCTNRNPDCDSVRNAFLKQYPARYEEIEVNYHNLHASHLADCQLNKETDKIWYAAIRSVHKNFGSRHILGIRAGESPSRLLRCRIWGETSKSGCAPLAWWTTNDVFAYLARYDLPIHPVYAMLGGGRWKRENLRVAEIGDTKGGGRRSAWEKEYYTFERRRIRY